MPKPRKSRANVVSESSLQATCCQWLQLDGWRHLRTDPFSDSATVSAIRARLAAAGLLTPAVAKLLNARGKFFGEEGMADDLFIRYHFTTRLPRIDAHAQAHADVMWCEWKSASGSVDPHQKLWQAGERARGALVFCAKVDFEPTIEGFCKFYAASGLQRRQVSIPRA